MHIYNGIVLLLIFIGVSLHRNRKVHPPIMGSCFVLDLLSVVYLEVQRGVIAEAISHVSAWIVQIHLLFAITTLIGYGVAIYTGRKVLSGAPILKVHKINACIFLVARTGVFVTSFFVLP